jgi:ribosomal-protein-alanine N-acetyltransferase
VKIASDRLDLVELPIELHRHLDAGRVEVVAGALGAVVPAEFRHGVPSRLRIEQLVRDPDELPWLVRALVLRDERRVVGSAGFHAPPDATGRAELGYEILEADRRRGFAREAVVALMGWAGTTGRVHAFRASIAPENVASQALVASLGFERVGSQIDPIDGLEWVYERVAQRSLP